LAELARVGPLPPMPTERIVAVLRCAFVVLAAVAMWSSTAHTRGHGSTGSMIELLRTP
jgi:hypothetical protein